MATQLKMFQTLRKGLPCQVSNTVHGASDFADSLQSANFARFEEYDRSLGILVNTMKLDCRSRAVSRYLE